MAAIMSVDLSMTMTAAVPMPDLSLESVSKSNVSVSQVEAGRHGIDGAAGNHRQEVLPAAAHTTGVPSISSRSGMPISSSTTHGCST